MFTTKIRQAVLAASAIAALAPAIGAVSTTATAGEAMSGRYEQYLQQEAERNPTSYRVDRFVSQGDQRVRIGTSEFDETRESRERDDRGQHFLLDVPRSEEQHYRGR